MAQKIIAQDFYEILKENVGRGKVCLDVRTEAEHDNECIAHSMNIPVDQLRSHLDILRSYESIYVYCASGNRSAMACEILESNNFKNVYDLQDGLNAWKIEKLPTVRKEKNRLPLMQQVLIVVGAVVFGSIILGYTVHELFFIMPLLLSIGLLYAGFSGNCLLTKILIRMPWNQCKK